MRSGKGRDGAAVEAAMRRASRAAGGRAAGARAAGARAAGGARFLPASRLEADKGKHTGEPCVAPVHLHRALGWRPPRSDAFISL